jgi:putative ABC transport system permease protein
MKLYVKLMKVTFFKAKDTKWIICVTSFIIAVVSMLMTMGSSITESYSQAVNQLPAYDFSLNNLNLEDKQKYDTLDFWEGAASNLACSTNAFEMVVADSPLYFSTIGLQGDFADVYRIELKEGHYPESDREIVVDNKFIENSDGRYKVGDEIVLSIFSMEDKSYYDVSYEIVGIMMSKSSGGEEVYAFLNLEGAERALAQGKIETSYRVMVTTEGKTEDGIERALECMDSDEMERLDVRMNTAKVDILDEQETSEGGDFDKVFRWLGVFIVVVSGALLFNMLQSSSTSKIQQIGMLRCLGLDKKQLYKAYILTLILYLLGALAGGALLSLFLEKTIGVFLFQRFMQGMNVSNYVEMSFHADVTTFAIAAVLVTFIFCIVYQILLRKSLKYTPMESLGYIGESTIQVKEQSAKIGKTNVVSFVGQRNLKRNKARTFYTAFTYFITALLIMTICMIIINVDLYDISALRKSNLFDYEFYEEENTSSVSSQMIEEIAQLDGVAEVDWARRQVYEFCRNKENAGTYNEEFETIVYSDNLLSRICKENGLSYEENENEPYYLLLSKAETKEDRIVMYDKEQKEIVLDINGTIGTDSYSDGLVDGTIILMNQAGADVLFPEGYSCNVLYLKASLKESCVESVKGYLEEHQISMIYSDLKEEMQDAKTQLGAMTNVAIYLMICIGAMTITNIICNINVNVQLRKREYGILIALGMTRKNVIRLIISEIATISQYGILLAFPVAFIAAFGFCSGIGQDVNFGKLITVAVISGGALYGITYALCYCKGNRIFKKDVLRLMDKE